MTRPNVNKPAIFPSAKRTLDTQELKLLLRIQKCCALDDRYTCIFFTAASPDTKVDMSRTPYIKLANDVSKPVARVIYELYNGPFNPKRRVRHACGQPRCVHPDHLYLADGFNNINTKAVVPNPEELYQKIFGKSQEECKRIVEQANADNGDIQK